MAYELDEEELTREVYIDDEPMSVVVDVEDDARRADRRWPAECMLDDVAHGGPGRGPRHGMPVLQGRPSFCVFTRIGIEATLCDDTHQAQGPMGVLPPWEHGSLDY